MCMLIHELILMHLNVKRTFIRHVFIIPYIDRNRSIMLAILKCFCLLHVHDLINLDELFSKPEKN